MKQPTECILWTEAERIASQPLRANFELLQTFVYESHWWRYLLRCRECGQLYFYEFFEEVDWQGGEDPQLVTWIPVESENGTERLKAAAPGEWQAFVPRLHKDWPKGQKQASVYWVRDQAAP